MFVGKMPTVYATYVFAGGSSADASGGWVSEGLRDV
jgi:hypothetical protein